MRFITLFSLILLSPLAHADLPGEMRSCAQIVDNLARLTCYDQLNQKLDQAPQSPKLDTNHSPVVQATVAEVNRVNNNDESTIESSVDAKKSQPQALSQLEDNFGKPAKESKIESISSTINGEFRGWVKGAVINLGNGQKWRVVSDSKGHVRLQDPEVTIEQGVLGTFNMRVKGFTPFAKVRRIQ